MMLVLWEIKQYRIEVFIIYWYRGKLIESETLELSIYDPGLLYGATVFTTLRVYNNSLDFPLTNWQAHCDRLNSSLQDFGWSSPDWQGLRQGAESIAENFPILRITIFPDGRELIFGRLLPSNLQYLQDSGVKAYVTNGDLHRSLPTHKTGNYLAPWLSKLSADKYNAQEAIFADYQGYWLETSTGNLWGWGKNTWWTPPLSAGILPGIMRSHLFKCLETSGQSVKEEPFTPEFVKSLEALAYSNCVVEIIPLFEVIQGAGSLKYNPYHCCFPQLRRFLIS